MALTDRGRDRPTAVFGLALTVLGFAGPGERISGRGAVAIGVGLGLAGATRPQLAPGIAVVLAGTWLKSAARDALLATALVAAFVAAVCTVNLRWFGHPLGALRLLQETNALVHRTRASFGFQLVGFLGLLVSPSRGLLVFSPVVLVAAAGVRRAFAEGWDDQIARCWRRGLSPQSFSLLDREAFRRTTEQ